jgi:hypothetical protein
MMQDPEGQKVDSEDSDQEVSFKVWNLSVDNGLLMVNYYSQDQMDQEDPEAQEAQEVNSQINPSSKIIKFFFQKFPIFKWPSGPPGESQSISQKKPLKKTHGTSHKIFAFMQIHPMTHCLFQLSS